MGDFFKVLGILVFGALLIFGVSYGGYSMYQFFSPRYEQVRRDTFEHSRAFIEGSKLDLEKLKDEWYHSTPDQKEALRPVYLDQMASMPDEVFWSGRNQKFKEEVEGFTK